MSKSGESDKFVTLIASLEGRKTVGRAVRKDVIQSESSFLKEYMEGDGATEIKIPLKRPKNLNLILDYLYEGQLNVSTENHLESLWNDARILGLVNLEKACIQRLTDTISSESWLERLEFSQAEGCHELESSVLSFVKANFEDCSTSPSFALLSVDQMVQVLQLPTVKTSVTESNRIALILDWIKANQVQRCCQAHRLLEQVDLIRLKESSLRSFFDEESAFRSWRSVGIFERAIRVKKIQEKGTHSNTVPAESSGSQPVAVEAGPTVLKSLDNRPVINIKQEVASEGSSSAEEDSGAEDNESFETVNPEYSGRGCRIGVKQEFSPPTTSSDGETVENNEDDPPPLKMPRLKYAQNEAETVVPSLSNQIDFVGKQKQIVYFSQSSDGAASLNFVIISPDSISQPQKVLASLPEYIHGVPKLIWDGEAGELYFLWILGHGRRGRTYMTVKGRRRVKLLPKMLQPRHHNYQALLLNGYVFVFGGSKSMDFKNNHRIRGAVVLNTKATLKRKSKWKPITRKRNPTASTATKRDLYAAACVEGKIYLTGGAVDRPKKNDPLITNSVFCYSPAPGKNRWKELSAMGIARCGHAVAVLGHKIYVFGGSGYIYQDPSQHNVKMKNAEVYDVRKDRWSFIESMRRPRYGASAVEIEGKIYVIGGDEIKDGKSGSSVECYDPVSNSWNFVCETVDDEGLFHSIAVIDDPEYFLKAT